MKQLSEMQSLINYKEDAEIFMAAYLILNFYPGTNKICFLMKDGFNPKKDSIDTLDKLKKHLKEYSLADFGLLSGDGLRSFQLKAYREPCNDKEFIKFIEKKLKHYAYNIGTTNLLIVLQSEGDIEEDFFENIHKRLLELKLKGTGSILITYNEENKFDVMNTVYPTLTTTRIPYKKLSQGVSDNSGNKA